MTFFKLDLFLIILKHKAYIFPLSLRYKGVKRQRLVCLALMQGRLLDHRPIDPSVFFVQGDQSKMNLYYIPQLLRNHFPHNLWNLTFHKLHGKQFPRMYGISTIQFYGIQFLHLHGIQVSTNSMKFNFPHILWNSVLHKPLEFNFPQTYVIQFSISSMKFNFPQIQ